MSGRKKKTFINLFFTVLLEVASVISGFIIPRLLISTFGSEINGLTQSIADFIGYVSLLQTGVGSAIKAALYKPLAKKDHSTLSVVVKTTERFFYKIAIVSVAYILLLALFFQPVLAKNFDYTFTLILVVIIGLSTAAQYFFGITSQMLLEADQKSYVYSIVQMGTIVLNTIAVIVSVRLGASVIVVKAVSAMFFVLRPIILCIYTRCHYKLDQHVASDNSYIKQRWDAFGQGIAFFLHSKTDIFVLTIFTSYTDVSIYSVYALVTRGLSSLLNSFEKVIRSAFGNILANDEKGNLKKSFNAYLTLMHILVTILFATATVTVFAFVKIYTTKVQDANYIQPLFGIIIIAAEAVYCLRLPYYSIIYAAGKFKETNRSAYIEAGVNILVSIVLVYKFGLIGVAIGTFTAMFYRTVAFIVFLSKNILELDIKYQIKRYIITAIAYVLGVILLSRLSIDINSYFSWAVYAVSVLIIMSIFTFVVNILFDKNNTIASLQFLKIKKTRPKEN